MPLLQVCLLSDNPFLDYLGCIVKKYDAIVWLYTVNQKKMITPIEKKLSQENSIFFEKRDVSKNDLYQFGESCKQVIKDYPDHEIILNVTGGTRAQALIAADIFKAAQNKVIFVEPEHSKIVDIQTGELTDFHDNLIVNEYFALYDLEVESGVRFDPEVGKRSALSYYIGNNIRIIVPFLDKRNTEWATMDENKADKEWKIEKGDVKFTIDYIHEKNQMNVSFGNGEKQHSLTLKDNGPEYFFRGGWLRELMFLRVHKSQYDDVRLDIRLSRDSLPRGERMESMIDIAMMKRGRFYIFQCFSFPITRESFVELNSIGKTMELLNAHGFVIMAHKPHKGFIDRAHSAGVKVVYGDRISSFNI